MAGFACQVVLNEDPTVWLEVARPSNTCTPPSFPYVPNPKNLSASIKNSQRKSLKNPLFGTSAFIECEIRHFYYFLWKMKIRERVWQTHFCQQRVCPMINLTFSLLLWTCGLYYKTITIVIMTILSDATIWSVTYDHNWRC
jgi:hypothetical protein